MKKYSIKIRNNRNVKTLAGGLPSFAPWELYDSAIAAAKAIADGAWNIIEADACEKCAEVEDDKFSEAISAEYDRVVAEIVESCGWSYDGVSYSIEEADYGRVCTGTLDGDNLINVEPLFAGCSDLNLCTRDDAEDVVREYLANECLDNWDVTEAPWGWTATWTEEDDDCNEVERTTEFCWVSERSAE